MVIIMSNDHYSIPSYNQNLGTSDEQTVITTSTEEVVASTKMQVIKSLKRKYYWSS